MSQLLGGTSFYSGVILENDTRTAAKDYQDDARELRVDHLSGFAWGYWPRSGFTGDPTSDGILLEAQSWGEPETSSGAISRFGYRGVTRDANNSPLGGVTVKIFRTADDTKTADDVVSDTDGNFIISTPYYEAHYLVMRKSGSPEVSGVTVSSQFPNS